MAKVIESIIPLEQTYGTNRAILYPERTVSSETMLRIYFMHNWFGLSDDGIEYARPDKVSRTQEELAL